MDVGERIAVGFVEAERTRRAAVPGAEVVEVDGLLLAFANVPDPPVNAALVISEPSEPDTALATAMERFRERDRPFGIDVAVGRHAAVDRAIRTAPLRRLFAWPAMAVAVDELPSPELPAGVRVEPVVDEHGAAAIAHVEQEGFGSDREIAERFYAAASFGAANGRSFVVWRGGDPVGMASAYLHAGAIGIFGVAVVPPARRQGIGTALSAIAARAFPADLAWLHTDDAQARSVYERLGFRVVAAWEVWVGAA